MGFCSQEYWSGLPFPSLGDLPHLGNDPGFPALQADSLLSELPGKPRKNRMVLLLQKKFHILSNYKISTFCLIIHTHWYTHTSSNSFYHPPQQHTWSLIQKNSSTDDGGYELTISWWQSRNFQRNFRCACMLTCVQLFVTPWIVAHPRSSVHGISQARILEWVAMSSSRGSSPPRNRTWVSCIAGRFLTTEPAGKPQTLDDFAYICTYRVQLLRFLL